MRSLLKREYEIKEAIKNVSFNIKQGVIVGYFGPNGAGKSTTIKMLSGILVPTNGIVEVAGVIPTKNRVENAKNIGVVFGQRSQLWWDIPVIESINIMKYMYKIPEEKFQYDLKLFFIIPYAFISYYPATYILNKNEIVFNKYFQFGTPV